MPIGTLVLSRKKDEETVLILPDGREIVHITMKVGSGKVQHGWRAPADVTIHRREVHEAIQERLASNSGLLPGAAAPAVSVDAGDAFSVPKGGEGEVNTVDPCK